MMHNVERLMAMVRAKNSDAFPRAIADALCNGVPCDECPYYPENPCYDLLYNDVKTIMGKGFGDGEEVKQDGVR